LEPPRIRRCANRCDFCFVDGLPEGLREVLYIRDDDYRLSFRYGNFATLTNLKRWDTDRIIEYRLSPLYVSVHATDPTIRRYLLRNPTAPDILAQLRHFADHGLQFHTQIVMSPGVNDGAVLEQSLADLYAFGNPVLSVSVVPVGLTEYSKHSLCREPTVAECRQGVAVVERWGQQAQSERGHWWVFGADELYLRAELQLPPESAYGHFEQVENGVGSVRFLQRQVREHSAVLKAWSGKRIGVVTGTSMAALMPLVLEPLSAAIGADFSLIAVTNTLFGSSVTSAGLLPGHAIREALANRSDLDLALVPGEALNDNGLFIDNLSLTDLLGQVPMGVEPSKYFADAIHE
jgi:putative radical SAM enzyme (TIGR03279 family)